MKSILTSANLLKGLCYTIAFSSFLFIISLIFILFTSSGNNIILNLISKYEPRLTVDLTEGSLFNKADIGLIKWVDEGSTYQFDDVQYEFGWRCLFNTLCIDSLTIKNAAINIQQNKTATESTTKNNSSINDSFPFSFHLKNVDIQNINLQMEDVKVDAKHLLLNLSGINETITLDSMITGLTVTLADSTKTQKTATKDTSENIPPILTDLKLPTVALPFNLNVEKLEFNDVKVFQNKRKLVVVNKSNTKFKFNKSTIKIIKLDVELPEANAQLSGEINLIARYPMKLVTFIQLKNITALEPENLLAGQHIKLINEGDLSALETTFVLSHLINAEGKNTVDLFTANLPYKFEVESSQLRWPLTGKASFNTTDTYLSAQGDLSNYQLMAKSNYSISDLSNGDFNLISQGNLSSLSLSELIVNTLKGSININGKLDWKEQLSWVGNLNINHIDLHEFLPNYSSDVSGTIKQSIKKHSFKNNKPFWAFDFPLIDLNGSLSEQPLTIKGSLKGDTINGINIPRLDLVNAKNKILIQGEIAEENNLTLSISIQDLNKFQPDTYGKLNGTIKLTGDIDHIKAKTNLTATRIKYLTNRIREMKLSGEVSIQSSPIVNLQLNAKKVIINKNKIQTISLNIIPKSTSNETIKHDVKLDVNSEIASAKLAFLFTQKTKNWLLSLKKGSIQSQQGTWSLKESVDISLIDKKNIALTTHCWESVNNTEIDSQLCINRFIAGEEKGDINVEVNDILANSLSSFVPKSLKLEGSIDSKLNLQWQTSSQPVGQLSVSGKSIAFNILKDDFKEEFIHFPVEDLTLNVRTEQGNTNFSLKAFSENLVQADFNGVIQQTPNNENKINANLDLLVPDFSTFSVLIPEVDKLAGQLQTTLSIKGQLIKPNLKGQLLIENAEVISTQSPLQISDLNADIAFDESNAKVNGYFFTNKKNTYKKENDVIKGLILLKDTAVSALNIPQRIAKIDNVKNGNSENSEGRADFNGTINWKSEPKANINFTAKHMRINDYGKIDLYLSPNINLKFDEHLYFQGVTKIEKGEITVKELPENAITISKDIVVIDKRLKQNSADFPFVMDLKLDLGEQLHVKALGLDSYIHGNLLVRKNLINPLTVNGELSFSDGIYNAFAQQLVLQNSRVIFQGQYDMPYLSLEAIRDPNNIEDDVTAGVRVTGLPNQLQLKLFSDTPMSQQNILSYITRGQAIKENSSVTNNQIAAALISFGTGQTEDLVNNIGATIGINDLTVATDGEGDQQSIGLKGTIAPGIELGYGVGVFDSFNVFSIRYKLFEKFYIEASSGLSQAVDAYYKWDWD